MYGDTMMFEAVEKGIDQGLSLEEVVPFWVAQIRCQNCRVFSIALAHQLKEGIDLLGFKGQISQLINQKEIVSAEALDEFGGRSIRQEA